MALQFDGIANALGPSSVSAREQLTRIRRQVEAYIREARQSIWDLRSPILETHDLGAALREFAQGVDRRQAGAVHVRASAGPTAPCSAKVENQLLRIGQEAITNAVRHAQARRIHLELTFGAAMVALRVEDDGRGIDGLRPHVDDANHYGLTTMRERAEELGGTFTHHLVRRARHGDRSSDSAFRSHQR